MMPVRARQPSPVRLCHRRLRTSLAPAVLVHVAVAIASSVQAMAAMLRGVEPFVGETDSLPKEADLPHAASGTRALEDGVAWTTLFCFAAFRPGTSEMALLSAMQRQGVGLYACDGHMVVSGDAEPWQPGGEPLLDRYIRIWKQVFSNGQFADFDWTVRVDMDTVVVPSRLRRLLDYHCQDDRCGPMVVNSAALGSGPIEAVSSAAMEYLQPNWKACTNAGVLGDDAGTNAERSFEMSACLEALSVSTVQDPDFVESRLGAAACDASQASFRPIHTWSQAAACLRQASPQRFGDLVDDEGTPTTTQMMIPTTTARSATSIALPTTSTTTPATSTTLPATSTTRKTTTARPPTSTMHTLASAATSSASLSMTSKTEPMTTTTTRKTSATSASETSSSTSKMLTAFTAATSSTSMSSASTASASPTRSTSTSAARGQEAAHGAFIFAGSHREHRGSGSEADGSRGPPAATASEASPQTPRARAAEALRAAAGNPTAVAATGGLLGILATVLLLRCLDCGRAPPGATALPSPRGLSQPLREESSRASRVAEQPGSARGSALSLPGAERLVALGARAELERSGSEEAPLIARSSSEPDLGRPGTGARRSAAPEAARLSPPPLP